MNDDLLGRLSRERGIGRVLARRLVDHFGPDLDAMVAAGRDGLVKVDGIGPGRVQGVQEAIELLAELVGPVPAARAAVEPLTLPPVEPGGPPISVQMPTFTLTADAQLELRGLGLDLVVELGQTIELHGAWDGVTTDDDGLAVIEWEAP